VVSHAFCHGFHLQHTERLAAYSWEAFGSRTIYSDQYGNETAAIQIHGGNGPHK
jgi:hemoglobin